MSHEVWNAVFLTMGPALTPFLGYCSRPGEGSGGSSLAGSPLGWKAGRKPPPPKGGLVAWLLRPSQPCPPCPVPSALPHPARQGRGCGVSLEALPVSSLRRPTGS